MEIGQCSVRAAQAEAIALPSILVTALQEMDIHRPCDGYVFLTVDWLFCCRYSIYCAVLIPTGMVVEYRL